ncbi:MAG: type VII toxin-antitoxin system HepT family RNase toxin [Promethearchaeota archaeon]
MPVSIEMIKGKFDIIERNLKFLNEYKEISEEEFINNYKDIQAVKYSLLEMIEDCIDIASHLISGNEYEKADTYSEMFEILGKNRIISKKLSINLSAMARFRNVLVHSYDKIENIQILKLAKDEILDIEKFIKEISEYIEKI